MAALLFVWCVLAWLLPALLLLPAEQQQAANARGQQEGDSGSDSGSDSSHRSGSDESRGAEGRQLLQKAVGTVEGRLRVLKGSKERASAGRNMAHTHDGLGPQPALFFLRWATVLCVTWELCCIVAPLYSRPEGWV